MARFKDSPGWTYVVEDEQKPVKIPDMNYGEGRVLDDMNVAQAVTEASQQVATESVAQSTPERTQVASVEGQNKVIENAVPQSVGAFKKTFFEGKISDSNWERLRTRTVSEFLSNHEAIYNRSADTDVRRLGLLRGMIETGMNIKPMPGETIESFVNRGAELLSERGSYYSKDSTFEAWKIYYDKFDPSKSYSAQETEAVRRGRMRNFFGERSRSGPFYASPNIDDRPFQAGDRPWKRK